VPSPRVGAELTEYSESVAAIRTTGRFAGDSTVAPTRGITRSTCSMVDVRLCAQLLAASPASSVLTSTP
jgi:hypothetical protein